MYYEENDYYNHIIFNNISTNPATYNLYSFEITFGAKFLLNYNLGIRFDPMKGESSIDFGYSF